VPKKIEDLEGEVRHLEEEEQLLASGLKKVEEEEKSTYEGLTRLQLIVFTCLIAFFILAAYGFYLIYSLTKDVSHLASDVSTMSESITRNMDVIANTMGSISGRMDNINNSTEMMANTAQNMAYSTQHMANSTDNMRYDLRRLNNAVSGPMDFMNNFMPGSRTINPPPGPPMYYPGYGGYPPSDAPEASREAATK
jgi:methyl-accepting chemotaxis protein